MSGILDNVNLHELSEEHIHSLILLKVSENIRLDYKKELNLSNDKDKREFCKDISALANTQGEYILFGVSEQNGIPISADGIDYDDKIKQQLYQVITSGISPRVQSISDAPVKLKNGKYVLILKVEPDGYLHQVKYDDNRFYKRTGTITIPMESSDVETFYKASDPSTPKEKIEEKVREYIAALRSRKYFKGVHGKGIMAITIMPELLSFKVDMSNLPKNYNTLFQPIYCSGWDSEVTGHAKFTFGRFPDEKIPYAVTEVTEFGELKAYNSFMLENRYFGVHLPEGCIGFIPSVAFEREIIIAVHRYMNSLRDIGVSWPFYIKIVLVNIQGYILYVDPMRLWEPNRIYTNENITPEMIHITKEDEFKTVQTVATCLQPTFDYIWREFGFERCHDFSADGEWKPEQL